MHQVTKIWLVIAGTVLLCVVWVIVNALIYVDVYPRAHPTQEQLHGAFAYGLFRQIVFLGGIALIIVGGAFSALRIAKHHNVPR
jgi:hypothetical protein